MTPPPLRPFEIQIRFTAQTYDIDFAGIVSNIVYIRWLEDLRLKLLEEHWPMDQQLREGYTPVLLSTQIEYQRALRLFDRPLGIMWMGNLGQARFTLEAVLELNGGQVTRATQVCAFVQSATLRPIRIPAGLREKYRHEQENLAQPD